MMRRVVWCILLIFLQSICFSVWAQQIRITEVYYDGADEWIELTNIGPGVYTGGFRIDGVKASTLVLNNITLPYGSSMVVGDNLSMLSTPWLFPTFISQGLQLVDSNSIDIALYNEDDELLDNFAVSQDQVLAYDNTKISFYKTVEGTIGATLPLLVWGSLSGSLTHAGRIYYDDGSVWTVGVEDNDDGNDNGGEDHDENNDGGGDGDDGEDESGGEDGNLNGGEDESGGEDENNDEGTGDDTGADENAEGGEGGDESDDSGTTQHNICDDIVYGSIVIEDVNIAGTQPQYIEMIRTDESLTSIVLSGSSIGGDSALLDISTREVGKRYLLTAGWDGFVDPSQIVVQEGLVLYTGDLTIYDQDDQLIWYGEVNTAGGFVQDEYCVMNVNDQLQHSPGFDGNYLQYIEGINSGSQQCTGSVSGGDSNNGNGTSDAGGNNNNNNNDTTDDENNNGNTGNTGTGSSIGESTPSTGTTISGQIDYSLLQFELGGVDVGAPGVTLQHVDITFLSGWDEVLLDEFRLRINGTNKRIYGMIQSGQKLTVSGNFGLLKTRESCIELVRDDRIYTTLCHDPTTATISGTGTTQDINYNALQFRLVNPDVGPPGETLQQVDISFIGGADQITLDSFRLRVNGTNKRIYGTLFSGDTLRVSGNFGMLKTKENCLELIMSDNTYDHYCFMPPGATTSQIRDTRSDTPQSTFYDWKFEIDDVFVGTTEQPRQSMMITLVGGTEQVVLDEFRLRINGVNRRIYGTAILGSGILVDGNFGILKTKDTVIELIRDNLVYHSFVYTPLGIQEVVDEEKQTPNEFDETIFAQHPYHTMQLYRTLPNPKGKDIKGENEIIALYRDNIDGQILTDDVALRIGKSRVSLSGLLFVDNELIIKPNITLSNQPACISLELYGRQIDQICYPQAKDNVKYYHDRYGRGPELIPDEFLVALQDLDGDLSKLLLKKIDQKICMTYGGVQIRCMNAPNIKTTEKNRALLTLSNVYIRKVNDAAYHGRTDEREQEVRRSAYNTLRNRINNNQLQQFAVYGTFIKPTELERYVALTYEMAPEDYVLDMISRILLGHQATDQYYERVYQ